MEKSNLMSFLSDTSNMTLDRNMKKSKPSSRKTAEAIELLEKYAVPNLKKAKQKAQKPKKQLTNLQKELLYFYSLPLSEQKMLQLKAFLQQLVADENVEHLPIQAEAA
jgi:hypothetical protein